MEFDKENLENFYELEVLNERFSRKLKTTLCEVVLKFKNLNNLDLIESLEALELILNDCVKKITEKCHQMDFIRFVLESDHLKEAIQIPYLKLSDFEASAILDRVEAVLQSNDFLSLDESLKITFIRTEYPGVGGGDRKGLVKSRGVCSMTDFISNKRCLLNIKDALFDHRFVLN